VVARPPRLPAIEYALFLQYAAFGIGTSLTGLATGVIGYIPPPSAFEDATALALAASVALLAGHAVWSLVPDHPGRRAYLPTLTPDTLDSASGPYVVVAAAFVVALALMPSMKLRLETILAVVLAFFDVVAIVAVATIAYLVRPRARTLGQLTIAMGAGLVTMIVTSMISTAAILTVVVVSVWLRVRRTIPVALVAAAFVLFYILQPVKSYYREIMWNDRAQGTTVVAGWEQAFSNAAADRYKESGSDATRERLSELNVLAYIVDVVPRSVPYLGGDAYEQTAIAMVPRVFWPDKPNMTKEGLDRYLIALGLTTLEMAQHSTMGIQLVAHGYASHGVAGGILWMAFFGFVVGGVNRFFGQGIAGIIAMSMFMTGWVPSAGSGFVSCFGSLWQSLFGYLALVWALWALGRLAPARNEARSSRRPRFA
jgi:hypothetical protein